jgi:hypothetical protein
LAKKVMHATAREPDNFATIMLHFQARVPSHAGKLGKLDNQESAAAGIADTGVGDQYASILTIEMGYEEVSDLSFTSADTVEAVAKLIRLEPGHRKRWAAFVTSAAARH